jgi:hypothetical protein
MLSRYAESAGRRVGNAGTLSDRRVGRQSVVSWPQSVAAERDEFLAQPFVNYNMAHGWYLTSSPVITANWLAAPDQRWTVPIGGGFGRIFKIGDQPVSANIAGYYNVVHPTGTPNWQLRAELSLLFPEK